MANCGSVMERSGSFLMSVPPPTTTVGGFCGRVVIAMAAGAEVLPGSKVRSFSDGMTALTYPVLSAWKSSVDTPRQRTPLL